MMMMRNRRNTGPAMMPTSSTGPHMEGCSGSLRWPGSSEKGEGKNRVKTREGTGLIYPQRLPPSEMPVPSPHAQGVLDLSGLMGLVCLLSNANLFSALCIISQIHNPLCNFMVLFPSQWPRQMPGSTLQLVTLLSSAPVSLLLLYLLSDAF